ncbi:unnamed protein product [Cyclocybe aegerita]|uniref:MINDY deubiquitinase domain-containing protein n=1 Tax=Cyclocybe aegerita TaxID=1973307 RepID=A0A8S0WF20_CYCAE|nr:unnamed protein product [Cyclocybe aegerita]
MSQAPTVQSSIAEVWYLKEIKFNGKPYSIITQNFNGPCSFIAICNILILRGNIEIQPPSRKTVSYEFLSNLVAEYLLLTSPDVDVSAALTVMPVTQKGMDLNPLFTSSTSFHPSSPSNGGGELKLFEHVGIPLVHGWLVDPDSPEGPVMKRVKDYDAAVQLIAEADHLTQGRFVLPDEAWGVTEPQAGPSSGSSVASPAKHFGEEDKRKVEDAIVVRQFLDSSQSQLTYYGLFHLATSLPPNTLCALFRNSHLAVLYKHSPSPTEDSALYTLVTDHVFLNETAVVWEPLEDVEGGSSFVDSDFVRSSPAGGDFAGQTAEEMIRAMEGQLGKVDPRDYQLAQQIAAEEEWRVRQERSYRLQKRQFDMIQRQQQIEEEKKARKAKKKGDCVIM